MTRPRTRLGARVEIIAGVRAQLESTKESGGAREMGERAKERLSPREEIYS